MEKTEAYKHYVQYFRIHDYSPLSCRQFCPGTYFTHVNICIYYVRKIEFYIPQPAHLCGLSKRKSTFHFNKPCSCSAIEGHLQGSDSIILPFTTGGKHFHGEWFA